MKGETRVLAEKVSESERESGCLAAMSTLRLMEANRMGF